MRSCVFKQIKKYQELKCLLLKVIFMPQWHILDSFSEKSRDSILHQLKRDPEALTVASSIMSLTVSCTSMYPSVWSPLPPSAWVSAFLSMGSPSVMVSSSSKLPLCHGQMVSKPLQLIADNVSSPKSSSKIPWGGLWNGLQQKKWADQSGQA